MTKEIDDKDKAMQSAGIIAFMRGLKPHGGGMPISILAKGEVLMNEWLYLDNRRYVGDFQVGEAIKYHEAVTCGQSPDCLSITNGGTPVSCQNLSQIAKSGSVKKYQ